MQFQRDILADATNARAIIENRQEPGVAPCLICWTLLGVVTYTSCWCYTCGCGFCQHHGAFVRSIKGPGFCSRHHASQRVGPPVPASAPAPVTP